MTKNNELKYKLKYILYKLNLIHVKIMIVVCIMLFVYGVFANNIRSVVFNEKIDSEFAKFVERSDVKMPDRDCSLRRC